VLRWGIRRAVRRARNVAICPAARAFGLLIPKQWRRRRTPRGRVALAKTAVSRHAGRVNSVSEAIRSLRVQVDAALTQEGPLPQGTQLEAESITLSLGLILEEDPTQTASPRWRLLGPSEIHPPAHSLTLQFRVRPSTEPAESASETTVLFRPDEAPAPAGPPSDQERLASRCHHVFGPPGFDNSARAEVFSESLAGLSPGEAATLLGWCRTGTRAPAGHPLQGKLGQFHRILSFAPVGEPAAAEILIELLAEHPIAELIQVLGEHWRFGTHWVLPGDL